MVVFELEGGGQVLVRAQEGDPAMAGVVTRGGGGKGLERAEETFEAALGTIRVVAQGVLGQLAAMARSPDEVTVEFGLELTARAGAAILVSAGTTAHLQVGLTWRPSRLETPAAAKST